MRKTYLFLLFALFSVITIILVHLGNVSITKNIDKPTLQKWVLLSKYLLIFIFGAVLHFVFSSKHHIKINPKRLLVIALALLIISVNFLTSLYYLEFYTTGKGLFASLIQSLLDGDNKTIINLFAGYLFGFAICNREQTQL